MSQDNKCYACGRAFRLGRADFLTVLTSDGQAVYVGDDCWKRITASGTAGYQPPLGGPRLYSHTNAPEDALRTAGVSLTKRQR